LHGGAGGGIDDFHAPESEVNPPKSNASLLWVVLLLGFSAIWRLQYGIDSQRAALHQEEDELVLRSGSMLKVMSLEYAPLIADLYWTRVVQYYGGKQARHDRNIGLLWPLLDLTTTLDPHLIVAYRFGSTFLSEPPPRGAGRPDLGIQLIERGIRENPEYWRFYEDLGFIYYFNVKDYNKAAGAFLEGSRKPGAMIWMKTFAAKISEEGESRQISAMLWSEIYNSATDVQIKKNAFIHLELLRAQSDCEQLDKIVEEYKRRFGRPPATLRDLVNAGLIGGAAVDPEGYVYIFDANGKAQLNTASPLYLQQLSHQKPL
jgi:hypothetical protein